MVSRCYIARITLVHLDKHLLKCILANHLFDVYMFGGLLTFDLQELFCCCAL